MCNSKTILIFVSLILISGSAGAITFEGNAVGLNGADVNALQPGEMFRLDLRVRLDSGDSINALGASIYNYDPLISFVSGQAVDALFFQDGPLTPPDDPICVMYPFACSSGGGITNGAGGALSEQNASPGTDFSGTPEIELIRAISLFDLYSPVPGLVDPGLDGIPGSAQFTVMLQAGGLSGTQEIIWGLGADLNGIVGPLGGEPIIQQNKIFSVTVVPEPGIALLFGLGLMSLAHSKRRR